MNPPVRSLQVNSQTTSLGREKKTEIHRILGIKRGNTLFSALGRNRSVQTLERISFQVEILLQDVQEFNHLGEDENPVSLLPEPGEKFVQQNQFTGSINQLLQSVRLEL